MLYTNFSSSNCRHMSGKKTKPIDLFQCKKKQMHLLLFATTLTSRATQQTRAVFE